jgi:hypothetical protein
MSQTRAVRLSEAGRTAFHDLLGVDAPTLSRSA